MNYGIRVVNLMTKTYFYYSGAAIICEFGCAIGYLGENLNATNKSNDPFNVQLCLSISSCDGGNWPAQYFSYSDVGKRKNFKGVSLL